MDDLPCGFVDAFVSYCIARMICRNSILYFDENIGRLKRSLVNRRKDEK